MRQIDRRTPFRGAKAPSYMSRTKKLVTITNVAAGRSDEGNRSEKGVSAK